MENQTSSSATSVKTGADNEGELFEIVNEANEPTYLAPRKRAHREGLPHRATHIFLFHDETGDVLLQRRSFKKNIGPGKWDLSCAEHNAPGETYIQCAVRGLKEELGVSMKENRLQEVREVFLNRAVYREGFVDCEYIGTFYGVIRSSDGEIIPDGDEVIEAKFWPIEKVLHQLKEEAKQFTPWMLTQLATLNVKELSRFACSTERNPKQ